jgi:hypothetical protein
MLRTYREGEPVYAFPDHALTGGMEPVHRFAAIADDF